MKPASKLFCLPAGLLAACLICGCGGGVSEKPTVTAKPGGDVAPTNGKPKNKGPVTVAGFGNFKGVIKYEGTAPTMGLIPVNKDPVCISNKAKIQFQNLIVNGENSGIQNVFVYLSKAPPGAKVEPAPEMPDVFDQKFCTFLPHAKIVRAGRTINVLNDDNTLHNTHSYPLSPRNSPGFNQSVSPNDREGVPMLFKGSERLPVSVKCDIHTWMTAYILPLDHDFAAVTDENGQFEIQGLPAGDHEFIIWQEKAGYLDRKFQVTIQADQTTEQTLSYGADRFSD